jgi:glycosyltransferase involved in cell wall biosynthesis
MTAPFTVSVIIPNHNYGDYVGAAIESALNLDWPDVEVIVVDNGSTDHSRAVITGFGSRITVILQADLGHLLACTKGFSRSRGDLVIFLDSDDLLAPSLVREVAAVWRPGVSKVQVQMQAIDAAGRPTGSYFPQYSIVPSPRQLRDWTLTTSTYPTPPGSGNVYARWFLERIFPLQTCDTVNEMGRYNADEKKEEAFFAFADTYCIAAAPLLGDVLTIAKPLVSYRVHGRNHGAISTLEVSRFGLEVKRALRRQAYVRMVAAGARLTYSDGAIDRSLYCLSYRIASLKLAPSQHPIEGDSLMRVLSHCATAFFTPQGLSIRERLLLFAWASAVAVSPRRLAGKLILWRFACVARPRGLRNFLAWLKLGARPAVAGG